MDITKMIAELHEERDHVDEAILVLSRLAVGAPKRRGRPPKWLTDQNLVGPKRRGRPPGSKMSAAARKAQSKRMKKYWATRRKQKAS
jgi:hypothetical protein